METILRCLILSLMSAASCQLFFETIVPCRSWGKYHWLTYTAIPAFTAGSMFIALTPIPPYILQPVRLLLVTAVIAQIYFQMSFTRNLILSVLYCVIYWSISTAVITAFYFFVDFRAVDEPLWQSVENLTETVILLLMMLFHYRYKNRLRSLNDYHGTRLRLLPLLYLIILVAFNMLSPEETTANKFATLAMVSSFAALGIVLFYFTMRMLEKEAALHRLQLGAERARSQIDMFHTMQRHYDQQRHFLHDYKNQLNCIQGLIDCGQITEASAYIARMTGSMRTQFGDINTNHAVVNIILNQKYQTAR
ncbi:MAG: Spo0B domain-containing protein, partial [Lachnospiraceae bacterium]|nr:Spo0B domain-containing protein [Lachnospiraceae bacterium]